MGWRGRINVLFIIGSSVNNSAGKNTSTHTMDISVPVPRKVPIDEISGSEVRPPTKNPATHIIVPDVNTVGKAPEIAPATAPFRSSLCYKLI